MTENPPEQPGGTPPPPPNPYGSEPSSPPPPPSSPYSSSPPPSSDPYAGNPPTAGQSPYGSAPPPPPAGQNPYGASAYPVSDQPPPVAGEQPAGLGSRFLARLLDGLLFFVLNVVIAVATNSVVAAIVGGIIYLAYYIYMESNRGATLGKQWLHMRVHGASGGNPTMEEAFKRNAWYILGLFSAIPVFGWILSLLEVLAIIAIAVTISSDPFKRGWHDKLANTSVTKVG